jgi:hypothetical protein
MVTRVRFAAASGAAAAIWLGATAHALKPSASHVVEPPFRLEDTGLYASDRPGDVDALNRSFAPQYPLWSDGLQKKRWVYLPPGSTIGSTDVASWQFPPDTRFWKEFSLDGRKVETRLLWKVSADNWMFASYVWNDRGTEAVLAPAGGIPGVVEVAPGRRYSIPSRADCTACHGARNPGPLGFNALQLSTDRDPNAIHGEPLRPGMLTLRDLAEEQRLSPAGGDAIANPPRIRTANPATRAVLGYLAANCGACHNGSGEISALRPTIRYSDLLQNGDDVARGLVGQLTRWQVPGQPDGTSVLVHPGAPEESALLVRMRSRSPSSQMPPLGTVLRDQRAVDAIARWIAVDLSRVHE